MIKFYPEYIQVLPPIECPTDIYSINSLKTIKEQTDCNDWETRIPIGYVTHILAIVLLIYLARLLIK